jgi:endonuclease/exonuclease/phosphatase (EEP) superfamily protein YafD
MPRYIAPVSEEEDEDDHPIFTALVKTALVLSLLGLIGGYLGWLHPLGDVLAIGRAPASAAVFILALMAISAGMRMAAFWSLLLSILTATSVILAYVWPGPPGVVSLYQKNLYYQNTDLAGLAADIRAAAPQTLTLQEVSPQNQALLADLKDMLPTQFHCTEGSRGGTAVASNLPMVPGTEVCAPGLAAMQVLLDGKPLWVVSIHLSWPWPYGQAAHVAELAPILAGLEGPKLIGGDFNMVRWAYAVQQLANAAQVEPAGPTRGTFVGFGRYAALPIDHVLATRSGRVTYRPTLGSDHLGILADLAL